MRKGILSASVVMLAFCAVVTAHAQVRSSSNYLIQSDSINIGGGLSSSTNYVQESTAGEVATGVGTSTTYELRAGYQQMQEVYIALSGGADVAMVGTLSGVTGGESNGSTTVTATTDSPSGYQLTIAATSSPAMQGPSGSIADYTPGGAAPDLFFTTDPTDVHFGFSPFGADVPQRFQTNGVACDVSGSASSTACWDGLSTTPIVVAENTNANHPAGTDTSIFFKVGIGSSASQSAGTYTATATVTLLPL